MRSELPLSLKKPKGLSSFMVDFLARFNNNVMVPYGLKARPDMC